MALSYKIAYIFILSSKYACAYEFGKEKNYLCETV